MCAAEIGDGRFEVPGPYAFLVPPPYVVVNELQKMVQVFQTHLNAQGQIMTCFTYGVKWSVSFL